MKPLNDKWSLVTGASRGVGSHVSEGLAQLGSNVVLHSRELSHTRALASKLVGLVVKVVAVSGELSDQTQVDAMLDPGWLRTDLGGPKAPNDPSSVIPGALVPALLDDGESGRFFQAQDYAGLTLARAVEKALLR